MADPATGASSATRVSERSSPAGPGGHARRGRGQGGYLSPPGSGVATGGRGAPPPARRCPLPRPHAHHPRVPAQDARTPAPPLSLASLRLVGAPPRFWVAPGSPSPVRLPSPPIQPLVLQGRIRMPPSVGAGGIGFAFSVSGEARGPHEDAEAREAGRRRDLG